MENEQSLFEQIYRGDIDDSKLNNPEINQRYRDFVRDKTESEQGRYSLGRAAEILNTANGENDSFAYLERLAKSAATKELKTYQPSKVIDNDSLEKDARYFEICHFHEVYADDLNNWIEQHLTHVDYRFPAPAVGTNKQKDCIAAPIKRGTAQDDEILRVIKKLGYDPLKLPKNKPGKAGVKTEVRNQVSPELFQGTAFKHAWERLRENSQICDE